MYEACRERPETRHSTPKSAPDFDLKLFKNQENPPQNMVVGGSTLCICGSQTPSWVMDSICQGNVAHKMASASRGTGSKGSSSWQLLIF
jgi:hypothetical protein